MRLFKKQNPMQSKFQQMKKMPMFPLMPVLPLSLMAGSLIISTLILIKLHQLSRSMEALFSLAHTGRGRLRKILRLPQKVIG